MNDRSFSAFDIITYFQEKREELEYSHRLEVADLNPSDRVGRVQLRGTHLCQMMDLRIATLYALADYLERKSLQDRRC